MKIQIITSAITATRVDELAKTQFGNLVKATVDVKNLLMALGGELHADEEQLLLEKGSAQQDLWGINLYPAKFGSPDFIEFDSMINIRPSQGNMSRVVEDLAIQKQIREVVGRLIIKDKK